MKILIHPLQREFDRLYKEMNDLYHDTALAVGLSDSCLASVTSPTNIVWVS